MQETTLVESSASTSSYLQKIMESRWTDVVLITGFTALMVIGILASIGVFNFMGTTNAAYLSYGMYGGASIVFIFEAIKFVTNQRSNTRASNNTHASDANIAENNKALSLMEISHLKQEAVLYANRDGHFKNDEDNEMREAKKKELLLFILLRRKTWPFMAGM